MRSGTHVLIDLILNNFSVYRQAPLYVQVDEFLSAGRPVDDLLRAGPYVFKSHVPQLHNDSWRLAQMRRLAEKSIVLIPRREVEATRDALSRFGPEGREAARRVEEDWERLCEFYAPYAPQFFSFEQMVARHESAAVVRRLGQALGLSSDLALVPTPDVRHLGRVLVDKALTRSLGPRAPRINTTIRIRRLPRRQPTPELVAGLSGAVGALMN